MPGPEVLRHIQLSSGTTIEEICWPLKLFLGITSFCFVRTYNDGSRISLSKDPPWLEHFYRCKYHEIGPFDSYPAGYQNGFVLWACLDAGKQILQDAAKYFQNDHGITLIEKASDYCEFYFFGTVPENSGIENLYINNLDELKRFTYYFKDQCKDLIRQAEKLRIRPAVAFNTTQTLKAEHFMGSNIRQCFNNCTPINKYRLHQDGKIVELTKRELACIHALFHGLTMKQAAKLLNISPRTIETHVEILKGKLLCQTKADLIRSLIKSGIDIL